MKLIPTNDIDIREYMVWNGIKFFEIDGIKERPVIISEPFIYYLPHRFIVLYESKYVHI